MAKILAALFATARESLRQGLHVTSAVKTDPTAALSSFANQSCVRHRAHEDSQRHYHILSAMPTTELRESLADEPATYSDAVLSSDEEVYTKTPSSAYHSAAAPDLPSFESLPNRERHEAFIRQCVDLLLKEAVFEGTSRKNKVVNYVDPEELKKLIDLPVKSSASSHEDLLKMLHQVVEYSVKTGHPYFTNQLFSSLDPYGMIGQWATDALNPSVYTYEVSPVFVLMEEVVLKEMRCIVGYEGGRGDGIFCPGGSMANGYAINCARHRYMPDIKNKGLSSLPRLVLFTSEDAHYSVKKLASFLGLGMDNVYAVRTDCRGRMDPCHLLEEIERALSEKAVPFMVAATAGTTVIGAFDPLEDIADICEKYKLWMHVDAAWGGGALMSTKHRGLLKGVERADSVTWNPHKLLTVPQQCSVMLSRHEGLLVEAHSANATYLFQKDKFYDTKYDTGDKHIQCGRRADVLKFWFMWKAKGTCGLERHVDKAFENAKHFTDCIRNREGFQLIYEPECTNVCFWYVPESLRGKKDDSDYNEKLHLVAPKIKERMVKEGAMMVTYQASKGLPNFFRLVFQNSGLEKSDMVHLIEEFERLGCDL